MPYDHSQRVYPSQGATRDLVVVFGASGIAWRAVLAGVGDGHFSRAECRERWVQIGSHFLEIDIAHDRSQCGSAPFGPPVFASKESKRAHSSLSSRRGIFFAVHTAGHVVPSLVGAVWNGSVTWKVENLTSGYFCMDSHTPFQRSP